MSDIIEHIGEDVNPFFQSAEMDEFCNSMHINISETLKLWGDVLIEGSEHGWCRNVQFTDKDMYYAMKILLTMCASKLHMRGDEMDEADAEKRMRAFMQSSFNITFSNVDADEEKKDV